MHEKARAYVKGNRLYILGLSQGPMGAVPFIHHVALSEAAPDGIVNIDTAPSSVQKALDESDGPVAEIIELEQMKLAAESLVSRARNGDQNAMGLIATVAEEAKQPNNQRAQLAFTLLEDFITKNPHDGLKLLPPPSVDTRISQAIVKDRTP